ncbi:MAG: Gfo/Idh/MocA family protein [Alkalibacterium gilvum]|uniref:Virulence factor n=1 Tax=Alkalibacterium gilvum TaxID=1130080 RepID=A0A1H6UAT4_9LACT|nr:MULTISPECIES: Gfo/Idh/MocA family oxidoreductase [Alkalibacterium]MDN6292986.1 Gfo/Idh/MocA family oxidoreductase [Alkalibacterium sp.]MDN6295214.1 Gfo/Idh/MocA family oxidoreductase [Alkalibacterium sp.]MDN6385605.1 Gfo/Idh/MocA family oxidoreductase [Alkalibacterium sp.]MDN6398623.1 Gfo/Idh/MocA family oxidoreductase [Alkalibacterium sp.]SEI89469.1 virulence factor [Alkalibacterium gilvum]
MKIGVIGLGGIAKKAYLPIYTTYFEEHEWYFSTRKKSVLKDLGKKYGVPEEQQFTQWHDLLDVVDAVFIHAPTSVHEDICRTFLEKGIPVFMDKPLAEHNEKTLALLRDAEKYGTFLMTGFNRRFAPMVHEMKAEFDINHLILQKNQVDNTNFEIRYRMYDMMIHPLDTALHLMEEPAEIVNSEIVVEEEKFKRAWVLLKNNKATAYVSINNESGTKLEKYEIQSPAKTITLENLTDKATFTKQGVSHEKAEDWVPTLEKRGFAPMVNAFIEAVETNGENPVSHESARLTHDICEAIIKKYESNTMNK